MTPRVDPRGIVLVDKPQGLTSHDVVSRMRRFAQTRRVGHAGTLDPMATGLLVLGVGQGTRLLTYLVGCDKEYAATIRLGQSTVSDDAEGELTSEQGAENLDPNAVSAAISELTGDIDQVPSSVSAIKIDGRRSYVRVRGGEEVALAARGVHVARFELLETRADVVRVSKPSSGGTRELPVVDLDVVVRCSSGTYIRALARDVGAALGVGGHLTALRRTHVGEFEVARAHSLESLSSATERGESLPFLNLAEVALKLFPCRKLTSEEAIDIVHGKRIHAQVPGRTEPVAAILENELIALLDESKAQAKSLIVFPRQVLA